MRNIIIGERTELYRINDGSLYKSGYYAEAGTPVTIGKKEKLSHDKDKISACPVISFRQNLYILVRDLDPVEREHLEEQVEGRS